MSIEEGLASVRARIKSAAESAGRKESEITLVAVSKFKPIEDIIAAKALGVKNFGENYIQEFCDKYEKLGSDDVLWHVIGPIQRNKVKYIADKNIIVETVDRLELAEELSKRAGKINRQIPVLIQVNTCKEDTKSGCMPEELEALYEKFLKLENINVSGLMTIGPNTDDMFEIEKCFAETYVLFEKMKKNENVKGQIKYLSMGMTNDYMLAIKHGANNVRVGRAIFGER